MFVNTKMDDGPCELVHSEELKEKFERDNDPFKYDSLIERDFLSRIVDIDRSIKVNRIYADGPPLDTISSFIQCAC